MKLAIPWTRLVLELFVIVAGILLALVADDWAQERAEARVAAALKQSLLVELATNARILETRLPYHQRLADSLAALPRPGRKGRLPALQEMGFDDGLALFPPLSRNAWDAARATDVINRLGIDLLFVLSTTYANQDEVGLESGRVRAAVEPYRLARLEGVHPSYARASLHDALESLVMREGALCESYRILGAHLTGRPRDEEQPAQSGGVPAVRCGSAYVEIR